MGVNKDKVTYIIENNVLDNVIYRALEPRPTEIAKYICGLTNSIGGYIFLGVEKQNGHMKKLGCQKTFNLTGVMDMVKVQLDDEIPMGHANVATTLDIYTEVNFAKKKAAMEDLSKKINFL